MTSPSKSQPFLNQSPTDPQELSSSTPSQSNPPNSNQRWHTLFLVCFSAFCYSFVNLLLSLSAQVLLFNRSEIISVDRLKFCASIFPVICGFMIYCFKIHRAYQFLAGFSAFSTLLTAFTLANELTSLSIKGVALLYATELGLWVAQIYMIIKCFKGKEAAFALGAVFCSDSVASALFHGLFRNVVSQRRDLTIAMAIIFCLLMICAVLLLSKIDMKVEAEEAIILRESEQIENEKSFCENLRLTKKSALMIIGAIFLFQLAYSSLYYITLEFGMEMHTIESAKQRVEFLRMSEKYYFYPPILLFLLFGYLADKTRKNFGMMLLGFVVLLIGFAYSYLSQNSSGTVLAFALTLRSIAGCMFQVSSWVCLSYSTEKRIFGVILGLTYGLMIFAGWFAGHGNHVIICILGIGFVSCGLLLDLTYEKKLLVDSKLDLTLDLEKKQEKKLVVNEEGSSRD